MDIKEQIEAIRSVIAYYMDGKWALRHIQHAFDKFDALLSFSFQN
jgi:hypothetical protein